MYMGKINYSTNLIIIKIKYCQYDEPLFKEGNDFSVQPHSNALPCHAS